MRVTNGMLVDNFLRNMQTNIKSMDKYSAQLSSDRRITRLSDDATGVLKALTARNRLAKYEQYQSNLNTAKNWVNQCETSLRELSGKLTDIRENIVASATDVYNAQDKQNIGVLINEFKGSVMETLNVAMGNQYVFAGFNTSNQPLSFGSDGKTVMYNGLDMTDLTEPNKSYLQKEMQQSITVQVGYSLNMNVTMTAPEVLGVGDDNLFSILDNIITALNSGDADASEKLSGYLGDLDDAQSNVAACLVKAGAMQQKISVLDDRYSEDVINYSEIRSNIEDIDSAETIMMWKMAEAVYNQTLSAGSRIIMPTLMDYLN